MMCFCIIFVCFIVYFIAHAAFVHIKLMMMMIVHRPILYNGPARVYPQKS